MKTWNSPDIEELSFIDTMGEHQCGKHPDGEYIEKHFLWWSWEEPLYS